MSWEEPPLYRADMNEYLTVTEEHSTRLDSLEKLTLDLKTTTDLLEQNLNMLLRMHNELVKTLEKN